MPLDYQEIPQGAIRVPVPDTLQETDYTCGASALQAVCKFFGVGPVTEREFVQHMGMSRSGSDPEHLMRAVRRYRLDHEEFHQMSREQLKICLDEFRPVILMLQAWGTTEAENARRTYRRRWEDGHWVVAIGYDQHGVYFEDPSIFDARGFLTYDELDARWHDWGANREHVEHYGLAVWLPGVRQSVYETRARRIG
jgi:predicted double-glycine peptidase